MAKPPKSGMDQPLKVDLDVGQNVIEAVTEIINNDEIDKIASPLIFSFQNSPNNILFYLPDTINFTGKISILYLCVHLSR